MMARDMAEDEREANAFWVFGYGSLMWKPGFPYLERRPARLEGFRRAFALASIHYRGTPERPGLVLGLDWKPGAVCPGVAFRVCGSVATDVRHYLRDRELVSRAYFEVVYPIEVEGHERPVEALCYILDRTHAQYRGALTLEEQAAIIAEAEGPTGTNADYLHATVDHLIAEGVEDADLVALDRLVRARRRA